MVSYFLKLPYDEYVSKVKELMKRGEPEIKDDFPVLESTAKKVLGLLKEDAEDYFVNSRMLSYFLSSQYTYEALSEDEALGIIYATLEVLYTDPEDVRRKGIYLDKLNQPIV